MTARRHQTLPVRPEVAIPTIPRYRGKGQRCRKSASIRAAYPAPSLSKDESAHSELANHHQATAFLGRPPNLPLRRAAPALLGVTAAPPKRPRCSANQRREPKKPSSKAGTYKSASNSGKCKPCPDGLSSITANSSAVAASKPCACDGRKATCKPESRDITTRAVRRSKRALTTPGCLARAAVPRRVAAAMAWSVSFITPSVVKQPNQPKCQSAELPASSEPPPWRPARAA